MNMKSHMILGVFFAAAICFCRPLTAGETAQSIMEKSYAVPDGDSFRKDSVLLVIKSGQTEKKEFLTMAKEYDRDWRNRILFSYPSRIGFLIWDEPGEDSQQWIKLTSGKVRKIATSEKGKPWMNSHFYNQDISRSYIEDYDYSLLGEETVDGLPCYKIKAVKIRGEKVYTHTILYVGQQDYLKHRIEFFENGLHTKTLELTNYETIDGVPTPRKMTMIRSDGKGKSILYVKEAVYGLAIDDRDLTREAF